MRGGNLMPIDSISPMCLKAKERTDQKGTAGGPQLLTHQNTGPAGQPSLRFSAAGETRFTRVADWPARAPSPGKRARRSTLCQKLHLCEVLRAEDRKADCRMRNSFARPHSGADGEQPVFCHSTRREIPGNTTS